MQLSFDAADRLVELVQARRGPVASAEAAQALFALERAPEALARSLLDDVVEGDSRLAWLGARVGLAGDPTAGGGQARSLLDGMSVDLRGPTAIAMTPDRVVWGTFEQGGDGGGGGIVVLEPVDGRRVQLLDGALKGLLGR